MRDLNPCPVMADLGWVILVEGSPHPDAGWPGQYKTVTCILPAPAAVAQVAFPWLLVLQIPVSCTGLHTTLLAGTKHWEMQGRIHSARRLWRPGGRNRTIVLHVRGGNCQIKVISSISFMYSRGTIPAGRRACAQISCVDLPPLAFEPFFHKH